MKPVIWSNSSEYSLCRLYFAKQLQIKVDFVVTCFSSPPSFCCSIYDFCDHSLYLNADNNLSMNRKNKLHQFTIEQALGITSCGFYLCRCLPRSFAFFLFLLFPAMILCSTSPPLPLLLRVSHVPLRFLISPSLFFVCPSFAIAIASCLLG